MNYGLVGELVQPILKLSSFHYQGMPNSFIKFISISLWLNIIKIETKLHIEFNIYLYYFILKNVQNFSVIRICRNTSYRIRNIFYIGQKSSLHFLALLFFWGYFLIFYACIIMSCRLSCKKIADTTSGF